MLYITTKHLKFILKQTQSVVNIFRRKHNARKKCIEFFFIQRYQSIFLLKNENNFWELWNYSKTSYLRLSKYITISRFHFCTYARLPDIRLYNSLIFVEGNIKIKTE